MKHVNRSPPLVVYDKYAKSYTLALRAAIGITHGFGSREQRVAAGADFTLDSLRDFEEAMQRVEHGE